MKLNRKSIGNIHTILGILSLVLLAKTAMAETQFTNEFWISSVPTNGTPGTGIGTLDNPFDGSTQARFDAVMAGLPQNTTIHLLAGTYQTRGSDGWRIKTGQKIIGSGIDVTILKFNPQNSNVYVIYPPDGVALTNVVVSDLTCDCNYTGGNYTASGVNLEGTQNTVRRVKVIHCAKFGGSSEAFGIAVTGFSVPSSAGNVIEECEVSQFAGGSGLSAITISAGAGVMRNNRVFLVPDPTVPEFGFNGSDTHDVLIEGNYVEGAFVGYYGDTDGTTNTIIAHNTFRNCYQGIALSGNYPRKNITIAFNNIEINPAVTTAGNIAFNFWNATITNVVILGNNICFAGLFTGTPAWGIQALAANNITGLVFVDNTIDPALTNLFNFTSLNVTIDNNFDLNGNYLTAMNIPTLGGKPVSSFGLAIASSAGASPALTVLGLPSNPSVIVTNNANGITLNGTFAGNGGGLTFLSPSAVSGAGAVMQSLVWDTNRLYGRGFGDARFNTVLTWNPNFGPGAWTNLNGACVYWDPSWGGYDAYTNVTYDPNDDYIYYYSYGTVPVNTWFPDTYGIPPAGKFTYGTNGYITVETNYTLQAGHFVGDGSGLTNVHCATQFASEFWISTNATGNFYTNGVGGTGGTLDNPLDGSSQANFDSNMQNLPANSTIHLLAGTYQTRGSDGWTIKTGQKIIGSGIDVTTLQLPPNATDSTIMIYTGDHVAVTNIEVSDLTCDANYTPGTSASYDGVELLGIENAVRRVKVINLAAFGAFQEVWGIFIGGGDPVNDSNGNIVEECEVSHFAGGPAISAIDIGSGIGGAGSGIIRNNRIFLSPTNTNYQAFNCERAHDLLIEGNYIDGAGNGVYNDTGGCTNLIITHNTFRNCISAVAMNGGSTHNNITIAFNNIELVPENGFPGDGAISFWNGIATNVIVIGNNLRFSSQGASTTFALGASGLTGLVFANNTLDASIDANQAANAASGSGNVRFLDNTNVSMYNNTDLSGNYLSYLNIPMIGNTPVTSLGLSLVGSTSVSSALTALSLPSSPSVIVTNNASGVTLSGLNVPTGTAYSYNGTAVLDGIPSLEDYFFGNSGNLGMTGVRNTVGGSFAMPNNLSGNYNTVFGAWADVNDTNGNRNTFIGTYAGYHNTGNDNMAIGYSSLNNPFNTWQNTAVGTLSLQNLENGYGNIAIGYSVAGSLHFGTNNIYIGIQNNGTNAENGKIYIGDPAIHTEAKIAGVIRGNGSGLTNLNASQLTSGTIPQTQLPGAVITNNATGITLNGTFSGDGGSLTGITPVQIGAAAATNATIWNSLSITNVTATNWATLSVTPSNAVISVKGINIAILQTNGVLNAVNGLATTVSNKLVAVTITPVSPLHWTNTTPRNVVVFINSLKGSVGYNDSLIFGPTTNGCATVMLQPNEYFSYTNTIGTLVTTFKWRSF